LENIEETSSSADQAAAMRRNKQFCGSGGRDEFFFGSAQRPEGAFGLTFAPPVVDAGEVDVLPDLRRDVADQVIGQFVPFLQGATFIVGKPRWVYPTWPTGDEVVKNGRADVCWLCSI
jgi:hypothetical protein